jgi:hypothetical protein
MDGYESPAPTTKANQEINLCIRPNVLDACSLRPSAMSFTPAPSFEREAWLSGPPALGRASTGRELNMLPSQIVPRELFVPDDF